MSEAIGQKSGGTQHQHSKMLKDSVTWQLAVPRGTLMEVIPGKLSMVQLARASGKRI